MKKFIAISVAVTVVVSSLFIVLNFLSDNLMKSRTDSGNLIIHTYNVMIEFLKAEKDATNVKRLEMIYLKFHHLRYLAEYNKALDEATANLNTLKTLTIDNPIQRVRVEQLQANTNQTNILAIENFSRKKGNLDERLLKEIMIVDKSMQIAHEGYEEENNLLSKHLEKRDFIVHRAQRFLTSLRIIGLFALVCTFIIILYQNRKHINSLSMLSKELFIKNQEAKKADIFKNEFLANMSHELRTPINGIIGFSQLLESGVTGPLSPEHKEYIVDILSNAKHLLRLIDDILDIEKINTGLMNFHPTIVTKAQLEHEIKIIIKTLSTLKAVDASVDIDPKLSAIVLDIDRFKQVLYNYISNAIKFGGDNPKVLVKIYMYKNDKFKLDVIDEGIGIAENDLSKLFNGFQQLDSTKGKYFQGLGLGLAITRKIIESQGGEVGVESKLGKGTTFYAILPLISMEDKGQL